MESFVNHALVTIHIHGRRQDFFGQGTPRPLKGNHAPAAGGPGGGGAKAPWTVAKFPFLKRFKVFENEFIF